MAEAAELLSGHPDTETPIAGAGRAADGPPDQDQLQPLVEPHPSQT